jgi:hypothetical protein
MFRNPIINTDRKFRAHTRIGPRSNIFVLKKTTFVNRMLTFDATKRIGRSSRKAIGTNLGRFNRRKTLVT